MELKYNVTGSDRKRLVTAMGAILETAPKYMGAPSFSYEVDYFTIDKNGTVNFDDSADSGEIEYLIERLTGMGFTQEASADAPTESESTTEEAIAPSETTPDTGNSGDTEADMCVTENTVITSAESLVEGSHDDYDSENMVDSLILSYPRKDITDAAIENLRLLVASKESLIKKALGVDALPIEVDDEKVSFPWFFGFPQPEEISAYAHFTGKLIGMAKTQKRITAKEKETNNDKYAFRCFLLRLGFIGDEYKAARKILLKNLSGSGAFKSGNPKVQEYVEKIQNDAGLYDEVMSLQDTEDGGND